MTRPHLTDDDDEEKDGRKRVVKQRGGFGIIFDLFAVAVFE
jgi:hypothetical protein